MKNKIILLVDDDQNDLEFILKALNELKFLCNIVVVNDGVEAMDFLKCRGKFNGRKAINPAVIILDIKMPRIDGTEVLKEIRGSVSLKNIPIVIFTSSSYEKDIIESYENGVIAYVVKPINISKFFSTVKLIGLFWGQSNELSPLKEYNSDD
ncbi:MAG: response regulator [Candidatus Delongbacteria bacterium]|nr:response regulator [Candidatus Delongbacteria bacterium]